MSNKMSRHAQRVAVFEFVFESFFRKEETASDIYLSECADRGYDGYDYIRDTFLNVDSHSSEIDDLVSDFAVNWNIDRISITARAVLRLSIYELLYSQLPPKVVINEAVEISKEFASEEESSFVNGILNRLARSKGIITD